MTKKWQSITLLILSLFLVASTAMAAGELKLVSHSEQIEAGDEFGVYLLLGGDGTYDVYGALTGGVLGDMLFLFDENGDAFPFDPAQPLPKLRSNLDLAKAGTEDKVIQLLPRLPLGGTGIAGSYMFIGALSTPGELDFPIHESIVIEIK